MQYFPRVDIGAINKNNELHYAIEQQHVNVINKLLSDGKHEVNERDDNDWTPLHVAAKLSKDEGIKIFELLRTKGANYDLQTKGT